MHPGQHIGGGTLLPPVRAADAEIEAVRNIVNKTIQVKVFFIFSLHS
jgi:hypothetical protein